MDVDEVDDSHVAANSPEPQDSDSRSFKSSSLDGSTSEKTHSESDNESGHAYALMNLGYQELDEYVPYQDPATGEIEMEHHDLHM